jgi:hypothetical protein
LARVLLFPTIEISAKNVYNESELRGAGLSGESFWSTGRKGFLEGTEGGLL